MKVTIKNDVLHIEIPVVRENSKSGKSVLLASTHGNQTTSTVVDGKPVVVSVNAYIRN